MVLIFIWVSMVWPLLEGGIYLRSGAYYKKYGSCSFEKDKLLLLLQETKFPWSQNNENTVYTVPFSFTRDLLMRFFYLAASKFWYICFEKFAVTKFFYMISSFNHCMKSARIQSFSGLYKSLYLVQMRKMRSRRTPNTDAFHKKHNVSE